MTPYFPGQPTAPEDIPEDLRPRIGPTAPQRARLAVAKALLPMAPEKLCLALGVLARDEDAAIAEAALKSLAEMPRQIVHGIAKGPLPAAVCDVYVQALHDDAELMRLLITNESTADSTVGWMAGKLRGDVLEHVARNQLRLAREPRIISALVGNPATPTPLLAPVVELALRERLDTSHIPGFRELARAFFNNIEELLGRDPRGGDPEPEATPLTPDERAILADAEAEAHAEGPAPALAAPPPAAVEEAPTADATGPLEPTRLQPVEDEAGIDEPLLELMLREGLETPAEESATEEAADSKKQVLWRLIGEMNVAQKVRLAVSGDRNARALLVRDTKKTVSMAVMRSPRLTDREVSDYAANKTLSEEVIQFIARKRDWTKNYNVRLSLVKNPKCPPGSVVNFLRTLRQRDLTNLARGHDAPAYVRRMAKMIATKQV